MLALSRRSGVDLVSMLFETPKRVVNTVTTNRQIASNGGNGDESLFEIRQDPHIGLGKLEPLPSWFPCHVIIDRKWVAVHIRIITSSEIPRAAVLIDPNSLVLVILWQAPIS